MNVHHFDAKTAFLNGDLEERINMKQPEGFKIPEKEHMVCKLNKSLYGLKQAAKVWNEKVDKIRQRHGFIQGMADPYLYVKDKKDGKMYLHIYVDDILIVSKKEEDIIEIGEALGQLFKLTNLGIIHHYLGMEIERD